MVWCPLSTEGQGALDHKGGKLVGKKFMVGQILEKLVEKKGKACTMDGRRHLKPSSPNWKLWCVMDSKHNKCVPIIKWRQSTWLWCVVQGANRKIQLHSKHDWVGEEDIEDKWPAKNRYSTISGSLGMPMQTSKCHQIPYHPHRNHGSIHIVVEWAGELFEKCWITHEVFTHH